MAYTNATFYIDLANGSDATRTTLTTCIASNPTGTVTRINKTGHGLVTGAVVTLSSFSTWLNDAWKITKVDNDNFDLDGAVWQTTADANGTVTPRGGSSWTDAWKTVESGASSTRIAPGDTIRVSKTADPTSIGNATWTSKSVTVTLASAQTTNIYLDGAWTAANSATSVTTTTRKEGATAASITTPASTATATKYAYYATGTLDLSSYDAITLWFIAPTTALGGSNRYVIKLCSDTTGDTAVDEFVIGSVAPSPNRWTPLTLTRTGGGSLGASIKSIALYTGSTSPGNSHNIYLDNILACSSTGLNLTSLISKSSSTYSTTETWHGLQSIDGTTVILGNTNATGAGSSSLKGYYTTGTSPETVTTYIMSPLKIAPASSSNSGGINIQKPGTAGSLVTLSGGWDTSSNTQNGMTWTDGQNGYGFGVSGTSSGDYYIRIERFGLCRYGTAVNCNTWELDKIYAINCDSTGISTKSTYTNSFFNNGTGPSFSLSYVDNLYVLNCGSATFGSGCEMGSIYFNNGAALTLSGGFKLNYLEFSDNSSTLSASNLSTINEAVIKNNTNATGVISGSGTLTINKLTSSGNTQTAGNSGMLIVKQTTASSQIIGIPNNTAGYRSPATTYSLVGGDANDHRSYWAYGNAISQTTTRHTASGIAWQVNITSTSQTSSAPALYPIAKVAVNADSLVTVKAWVKLSHATDIGAKLLVQGNEIPGVTADVTATKTADTNWEELTITFTPTVKGVVQVYLAAYWLANLADESVYVDDITVTQA